MTVTKQQIAEAVRAGLMLLSDPQVRAPVSQDAGRALLRALLNEVAEGRMVIAQPATPTASESVPDDAPGNL